MNQFRFCVAMSDEFPGTASASCIAEDKKLVKEFYRDHAGQEIRVVGGDEMSRLMRDFLAQRKSSHTSALREA